MSCPHIVTVKIRPIGAITQTQKPVTVLICPIIPPPTIPSGAGVAGGTNSRDTARLAASA